MKVALIGSNSFLAQYIIREFMHCNIEPTLYGIVASTEYPGLKFYRFNIPEFQIVLPDLLEFDIIIYTAGAGIQTDLQESPDIIYELNSFMPIRLLNFLSSNNFKGKVITFGSYFEIGNETEERYYNEIEVALSHKPISSHYASSKRILTRYLISSPGLPDYFHIILPNIYGKGENPNRLIPYLVDSIRNGTEIKLTSGTQVRQYIHAADNARAVLTIAKNDYQKGLYNLCNREPVQIKTLVKTIFTVMGKESDFFKLKFGTNQRTDTSMTFLLLNNEKATGVLNFLPSVTLEEGIHAYLKKED